MSTTILNTGNAIDVDIASLLVADMANFSPAGTRELPNNGGTEALYRYTNGNKDYPLVVRVGHYVNPKAHDGVGKTNISIQASTFVQETDADSDVLWTLPGFLTTASNMPGLSGIPDEDDYVELLGIVLGFYLQVVAGVVSQNRIDKLKFGVVTGQEQLLNTASA